MKIGFLGVGNMGSAILRGYVEAGNFSDNEFIIFNRTKKKAENLKVELENKMKDIKIDIASDLEEFVEKSDIFFIGVKPKDYDDILNEIGKVYRQDKVCVSMAAGISIENIKKFLGENSRVIRIMPNTPAQIGKGATSISKDECIEEKDLITVSKILESVGVCIEVEESLIHSVIGASGSSPAYTYMYMDALIKEAKAEGLEEDKAKVLVAESVIGAANMLMKSNLSAEALIEAVSSPNGTTVAALESLRKDNFENIVRRGFSSAVKRSREMEK